MRVEDYSFGKIVIDGKEYFWDVELRPWSGEVLRWQRKESHLFDREDIERAVKEKPKIIVFGTGEVGMARISQRAREFLKENGIEIIEERTKRATEIFNDYAKKKERVIGLFHLTC